MSSNQNTQVIELAEKLASDRKDEMFTFLISLLEARGIELTDNPAIEETLLSLENEVNEAAMTALYAALQKTNPVVVSELDRLIDGGTTYDEGYDFIAAHLPGWETVLAKVLLSFAQKTDEEVSKLAERVERDREKTIYTFSMSTLMILPFIKKNEVNQEDSREMFQDAHRAVIKHLSASISSIEERRATGLLESGMSYDQLTDLYTEYQRLIPTFTIEVAKALLAFQVEKQKQALETHFREVPRIKRRKYTDEQIARYVVKLYSIWTAFGKDYTGQEQFLLFFNDAEIQANFDELLDKEITANDVLEAISAWYKAGNHMRSFAHYVSPFQALINRLLA